MGFMHAKQCRSTEMKHQFFECGDLLKHSAIKVCLWLINLVGIVANVLMIEIRYRNYNKTGRLGIPSFMFGNLGVSGVFMGVYSLMLGFIDLSNENLGTFFINSDVWRESTKCKVAGAIALLSIQSMIFILTAISVERFIKVMCPTSRYVFGPRGAKVSMLICWTVAMIIGVTISFSFDPEVGHYGWTDTCIGLPLHRLRNTYFNEVVDLSTPVADLRIVIPTLDNAMDQIAWPISIALFLIIDPTCLVVGLVLFLVIKIKGEHEELLSDDEDDDDDVLKKKQAMMSDAAAAGKTAQTDLSVGVSHPNAVDNKYATDGENVYEECGESTKKIDIEVRTTKAVSHAEPEDPLNATKLEKTAHQIRKVTKKRRGSTRRLKMKKQKSSLGKKDSAAPEAIYSIDGVAIHRSDVGDQDIVSGKQYMKDEAFEEEGGEVPSVPKKMRRRRRKRTPFAAERENACAESDQKKGAEAGGIEEYGSDWETDTSASNDDDEDPSDDDEMLVEIEERKITSKNLALKMMQLFAFNVISLSPIFIIGILSQTGVVEVPMEFTYWTALFILPFLACLNPFVICCVDIGGIRPQYEWQFEEVSYSETLSEKRDRVAREALTFI